MKDSQNNVKEDLNISIELDTSNLICPLPLLKTKKMLSEMKSGEIIKVIATDTNSMRDFAFFSEKTGHLLLKQEKLLDKYIHIIRKK